MATGHTPSRKYPEYWGGDIPWMNVGDAKPFHGRVIRETSETTNPIGIENSAAVVLPQGTVCLSRTGSIGYAVILGRPMATSQGFVNWICGPELLPEFLQQIFLAEQSFLYEISEGVAHTTIYFPEAKAFHVCIPSAEQQRRIVAELEQQSSRLDEAIATLKRAKVKLGQYESGVLDAAVDGRLVAPSKAPWSTVTVADVGDVLLGRRRAPEYLASAHERKYLRVANVKDDRIDFSDLQSMRFDEQHVSRYDLAPGDVLVSEGQSPEKLGQSAIFHGYPEPLCFQSTLHRFRARRAVTSPEFAQIVFRSHVRSGVFRRLGSITTNIGHLTLEKFKAAPFPLPPLDEQRRIVAEVDRRLSIVREVEAEVDGNLARSLTLRRSVLARAFAPSSELEALA